MLKPLSFNGKALVRTVDSYGYCIEHKFTISWTPTYYDSPTSIDPVYFNVATVHFANGTSKTFKSNEGPITHANTVEAYGSEITSIDFVDSQFHLDTVTFTSNYYVTPMESLMSGTRNLRYFYGNLSMDGNTSVKNMFNGCYSLGKSTNSGGVFGESGGPALRDCNNLTSLEGMFSGAFIYYDSDATRPYHEFDFDNVFDDLSSITSMKNMFRGCSHLGMVRLVKKDGKTRTPSLTDMSYMFYNTDLRTIDSDHGLDSSDLSGIDTSNVTDMSYMFANTPNLEWVEAPFDTHNVTNLQGMFSGSGTHTYDATGETSVAHWNFSNATNMSHFFSSCSNLTYISLRNNFYYGDSLVDVSYMCSGCTAMYGITMNFVGAGITNMSYMFNGCSALEWISMENLSLTGTPNMTSMFSGCSSLSEITLSKDVTSNTLNLIKNHVQTDVGGTWSTRSTGTSTILYKG